MVKLIDGNSIAQQVLAELKDRVEQISPKIVPHVVVIRVGDDPASVSYVAKKQKTAAGIGIKSTLKLLPEGISQVELESIIDSLNLDPEVHGILVQAPLPPQINAVEIFNRVAADKDVDGFSATNLGRLTQQTADAVVACTPMGILEMLLRSGVEIAGKHVVVLGRSLIVGKPLALLLLFKKFNATVTIAHSGTRDLSSITSTADILISAIGNPGFVTAPMVKPGAIVVDVGINRVPDAGKKTGYRLVGDVDFEHVAPKCSLITPVPGGVGPMTVAMLMKNTLNACLRKNNLEIVS